MQQQVLLLLGGDLAEKKKYVVTSLFRLVEFPETSLMMASPLSGNLLMDALLFDVCEQLLQGCVIVAAPNTPSLLINVKLICGGSGL